MSDEGCLQPQIRRLDTVAHHKASVRISICSLVKKNSLS